MSKWYIYDIISYSDCKVCLRYWKEFIDKHRPLIYGAGTIQIIMLIIPILKILFNPFGTIGATIIYVDLLKNKTKAKEVNYGN